MTTTPTPPGHLLGPIPPFRIRGKLVDLKLPDIILPPPPQPCDIKPVDWKQFFTKPTPAPVPAPAPVAPAAVAPMVAKKR